MDNGMVNVLIVGVGGQGVILASNILCEVAMRAGYDVKKSEVHGMSQRGGVVTSHVRFGKKVNSPLIAAGTTDVMLAFEASEALRFAHEVKEDGLLIASTQTIQPPKGPRKKNDKVAYPTDPIGDTKKYSKAKVIPIDADGIARGLGNFRLANTILLGAMSTGLDIPEEVWVNTIKEMVPPKTIDLNLKAFDEGKKVGMA